MIDLTRLEEVEIEIDSSITNQLNSISRILNRPQFTHCANCDLSYMPIGNYNNICPQCGELC